MLTDSLTEELFLIYQAALNKPKELGPEAPKKPILPPLTRRRLELLREKLNEVAQDLNVPPRLIAPKNDLIALAEGQHDGNRILIGWRHEVVGHQAENLLK